MSEIYYSKAEIRFFKYRAVKNFSRAISIGPNNPKPAVTTLSSKAAKNALGNLTNGFITQVIGTSLLGQPGIIQRNIGSFCNHCKRSFKEEEWVGKQRIYKAYPWHSGSLGYAYNLETNNNSREDFFHINCFFMDIEETSVKNKEILEQEMKYRKDKLEKFVQTHKLELVMQSLDD